MPQNLSAIAAPLVAWFQENKRPLPWRQDTDPYHVWVSEIMLQQTRIEAVMERYGEFMAALPTLGDLAAVDEEKLLKLWEGMGYYSRARNLKKAAEVMMRDHAGAFPRTAAQLKKLPGIGDYTAGAIASICFNEKVPAVDGNVLRVLARVRADSANVLEAETKKRAETLLKEIMPEQAGAFNEGLMELGETVCLPNAAPLCARCPICEHCLAFKKQITEQLPVRMKNTKRKAEEKTVFIFVSPQGETAIEKRPDKGLLSGLYQLPNVNGFLSEAQISAQASEWQLAVKEINFVKEVKHVFTHIDWFLKCCLVVVEEKNDRFLWCTAEELEAQYPLPTAFQKCL